MIENMYAKYGKKLVVCDSCGDGFEAENWDDAVQQMKDEGWKQTKENGKWHHYCPECK